MTTALLDRANHNRVVIETDNILYRFGHGNQRS